VGMFAHLINSCAITRITRNRGQAPRGFINILINIPVQLIAGPLSTDITLQH
jgi:hypothetical protein